MHKLTLSKYIHGKIDESGVKTEAGPYITLSREPGCEGYKVGELLLEMLNQHDPHHRWQLFKKEILHRIAQDTKLADEIIEQKRHAVPSLVKEFFRGMSKGGIPDDYEIRSKIANMVRAVAYEGYAIIIGQGGTAATADIPNGLSIRLEAPKKWRLVRVCKRDNLSKEEARAKIEHEEEKRAYLRKLYEEANPHTPVFNLTIDNSVLNAEQIATLIYDTMQLRNMIPSDR
jgi:cytidylate kinase